DNTTASPTAGRRGASPATRTPPPTPVTCAAREIQRRSPAPAGTARGEDGLTNRTGANGRGPPTRSRRPVASLMDPNIVVGELGMERRAFERGHVAANTTLRRADRAGSAASGAIGRWAGRSG